MSSPFSYKIFLSLFFIGMLSSLVFQPISYAENNKKTKEQSDIFYQARPSLTTFTSTNGLPVNAVMTIERDSRGFIWFGTQDGAAVYNGYDLTVVDMPNRSVSNYIYDILAAQDGSIWFATSNGGVHRLKNNEWKTFDTESGLASNETRALFESFDEKGKQIIWIGRRSGLTKLVGDKIENYDEKDGLPDKRVRSIIETTDKNNLKTLWIGTYGGIAIWQGYSKKVFNESNGLPGKTVFTLLETKNKDGESEIWAGTEKGVFKFENKEWKSFENESEILSNTVRALGKSQKADGTETIWVGFDGKGLAYLENDKWFFIDEKQGLPNDMVFGFSETGSADGSVWVSTLGKGVTRLERSNWRVLDKETGLPNEIVFSIEESKNDGIWIGTFGGGLANYTEEGWTSHSKDTEFEEDYVQTLLSTKDKNDQEILFVGGEKGLKSFQNGNWQKIKLSSEKGDPEIWDIKEFEINNSEKKLLISTSDGVFIKNGDEIKQIGIEDGLPDNNTRSAIETISKSGKTTLWIATYNNGLVKVEDGKSTIFDKNNELLTNRIYSVSEIKYGNKRELWVGTGGGGIAIHDLTSAENKFKIINTENSNLIPGDTIYQIFQDSKKRIYATSNKGISRITPQVSGDITDSQAYVFTTRDGLPNNECTAGSGFIDSKNRVWVGTVGGAAVLDLSKEFEDKKAEPIFLQNVLIAGEEKKLLPDTQLSYNENNLVFEYVMPTNFREAATVYRSQMIGLEDKPTEWTREPRREFNFIPSGNFTFKVWGKDASGNISQPFEIPFTIRPPWWMTWWAIILYFLATIVIVGFIAFLIYRNRYRRMLEIERVRTRIATDLHDDVGSSLSKISILSEVLAQNPNGLNSEEKQSLSSIAETSREVVGSMSDMVWSINPNKDNLRDTVQRMRRFASELLSAKDIDFTFNAPMNEKEIKLDVDMRRQLYLLFKESVNNCVKHSDCTKVQIDIKRKADGIYLKIEDNGNGFDISNIKRGNGLVNMKKRAEDFGGDCNISTEEDKGTIVKIKLPMRNNSFSF